MDLTRDEVAKVVKLLAETELSMPDIAKRMNRSGSLIHQINDKYRVRQYKSRTEWRVAFTGHEVRQ